jgi:4-hydroxy-tetrahydrodipicolinate reductase
MIRVCLAGATGWVGRDLARAIAAAEDLELVAAVSRRAAGQPLDAVLGAGVPAVPIRGTVSQALATPCDVLIDYTSAAAVGEHVLAAVRAGVHAVVGSSGLTDEDYAAIDREARARGVGVIAAGNFALTAVLLQRLAEIAARHVPHWEIIDYAPAKKIDAPSGTARELASRLARVGRPRLEHPVDATHGDREARGATLQGMQAHSVRLPGFVSSIEILFGLPEERLSIRHDSSSGAQPYISGTLLAVRKVGGCKGVTRGLDRILEI